MEVLGCAVIHFFKKNKGNILQGFYTVNLDSALLFIALFSFLEKREELYMVSYWTKYPYCTDEKEKLGNLSESNFFLFP